MIGMGPRREVDFVVTLRCRPPRTTISPLFALTNESVVRRPMIGWSLPSRIVLPRMSSTDWETWSWTAPSLPMSGQIVVLGGLQRKVTTKSTSRLGPIPIIGDLFGSSTDLEEKQELIIFLRPYVLNGSAVDNLDALSRATSSVIGPDVKKVIDNVPGTVPAAPEKK